MNSVHTLAINSKDLNLLPIFYALMLERSVSKVAKRLSLTQSAVSHALGRLRRELGDDLLVRAPQGMVPTPFALALMPRVAPLMAALTAVYQMDSAFDPGRSEAVFRVATTDFIEATLMQDFLPRLRREAPGRTRHGPVAKASRVVAR